MPNSTIKLIDDSGRELSVDNEAQAALIEKLGYRRVQPEERASEGANEAERQYYTSAGQKFQTALEGGVRGASLGFLPGNDDADVRASYNPTIAEGSQLAGAIAPALVTGGDSLAAGIAEATPTGALTSAAGRAAEALADSRVARGAIQGSLEATGAVSANRLADTIYDKPEAHESIAAELGVAALLGGGMGALGGAFESAGARAEERLGRAAEGESVAARYKAGNFNPDAFETAPSQSPEAFWAARTNPGDRLERALGGTYKEPAGTAADDFVNRGDMKVRLDTLDNALDMARSDVAESAQNAESAGIGHHEAAFRAEGYAPPDTSVRDVGREFRTLKSYGDELMGTVGADPELARAARADVAGVRKAYTTADEAFKAAKTAEAPDPKAFASILEDYRTSVTKLAKRLGREDVPGEFRFTEPPSDAENAAYSAGLSDLYSRGDSLRLRAEEASQVGDQLKAVHNLSDLRGTTPEDFLRNAQALDAALKSPHVTPGVKRALKDALSDVAEHGMGITKGADLSGLSLPDAARAMGASDEVIHALKVAQGLPGAQEYATAWTAVKGLERQTGKVTKLEAAAKAPARAKEIAAHGVPLEAAGGATSEAAAGKSSGMGRMAKYALGGAVAHQVHEMTGSWLLGAAAFQGVAHGGIGGLDGLIGGFTSKITKAVARWGGPVGAVVRKATPFALSELALHPVPKGSAHYPAGEFREVAAQWRQAAGPDGANALHAALAPLRGAAANTGNGVAMVAQRVAANIAARAPQDPGTVYAGLKSRWQPDDIELSSWLRYAEGALHPERVVQDFASGTMTPEGAQALRECWPATFDQVRGAVVGRLAEVEDKLPYDSFVQLSSLLDLPAEGTMTQEFIVAQQQMYAEAGAQQQPKGPLPRPQGGSTSSGTKAQQLSER